MRNAFAKLVTQIARIDRRVVLLTGDIGNKLFDDFRAAFPSRFYNCGIAEANMVSMAAGMAMCGLRPVVYTIAPFVTARCLEQIRVDLCYHEQPVILVGVGSGLCYAELGATHQACEDIAMLRSLPGMSVVCPADCPELAALLPQAFQRSLPCYFRLGKKGEESIHLSATTIDWNRAIVLREGADVALVGAGVVMPVVLDAAAMLSARGLRVAVLSVPVVKPLDTQTLDLYLHKCRVVVTVEEHSMIGGLGSAVAEWVVDRGGVPSRILRMGVPDRYIHTVVNQEEMRRSSGLDPLSICDRVWEYWSESIGVNAA